MARERSEDGSSDRSTEIRVNWNDRYEYLQGALFLHLNEDYWEFLVRKVWCLDRPCGVVEFGCGYGRMGLVLLSLLPPGSTYTGIDTAEALLAKGREIFADLPYEAKFVQADIRDVSLPEDSFDVAFSHTALMHVPRPEEALAEMIRVTAHGGMVITCEANRNAANALFHIHETDELDQTPLALFQTMNGQIRRQAGIDYNVGIKLPILMHKAGLKDVGCRISDAVRLLFGPLDTPAKQKLHKAICDQGFGYQPDDEETMRKWVDSLVARGISRQQADREVARELQRDFLHRAGEYHTAYPGLLTFSYGTVDKADRPCGKEIGEA